MDSCAAQRERSEFITTQERGGIEMKRLMLIVAAATGLAIATGGDAEARNWARYYGYGNHHHHGHYYGYRPYRYNYYRPYYNGWNGGAVRYNGRYLDFRYRW
jgi:hypothetical protein